MKPIRERKRCIFILKPPDLLWDLNIRDRFKPIHVIAGTDGLLWHRHIELGQELTSWKMKGSGQSDKDAWNQMMYKGGGEGALEGWKDKFL